MANTFVKIASTTVGSGGSSAITFSSIPNTYTDLVIKISGRTSTSGNTDTITLSLNGSSSNISGQLLFYNSNAGGALNASTSVSGQEGGFINGATSTSSTFSNVEIYFTNYASTSNPKRFSVDSTQENNATGTNAMYMGFFAELWNPGSQVAISSITLTPSASFVQYSTATLYGISNS